MSAAPTTSELASSPARHSFAASDGSPPSFVYSEQGALWGERQAVGFGNGAFRVSEIEKAKANAVIVANHYSRFA